MTAADCQAQVYTLAEAADQLGSPYANETFSPLTGSPQLIVDLGSGPVPRGERLETLRRALSALPCPTIALVPSSAVGAADGLRDRFDLVLDDSASLSAIVARISKTPLAAMALVQLLRQGESLDLYQALVAESLVYSTLQAGPEFAAWLRDRRQRSSVSGTAGAPRGGGVRPAVRAERHGDMLALTLDRPERHNAFSMEMRDALVEGLQLVNADASIREVVLRGAGPSFCSGGDLDEFGSLPDPATAHAVRSIRNAAHLLVRCADRVRVELHGACIGAGIELPAFAKHVTASENAFFELPELGLGLVPGAGGTARLPRRIGRQRTAYLALSGVRLEAPTALRWGLLDELRIGRSA